MEHTSTQHRDQYHRTHAHTPDRSLNREDVRMRKDREDCAWEREDVRIRPSPRGPWCRDSENARPGLTPPAGVKLRPWEGPWGWTLRRGLPGLRVRAASGAATLLSAALLSRVRRVRVRRVRVRRVRVRVRIRRLGIGRAALLTAHSRAAAVSTAAWAAREPSASPA